MFKMALRLVVVVFFFDIRAKVVGEESEGFKTTSSLK